MFSSLIKKLNEPFPSSSSLKQSVIEIFWVSLFIAAFLYLFKPFGVNRIQQNQFLICLGFGFVTFVVGTVFNLVQLKVLKLQTDLPTWTLWKWILEILCLMVCIAFGNIVFNWLIEPDMTISANTVVSALLTTLAIGIFPCVVSGFLIQMRAAQSNQRDAANLNSAITDDDNNKVASYETDIKYIEAMQNYVEINYGSAKQPPHEVIRSTIQATQQQYQGTPLVRCHRSFIVNTDAIESVSGNAQGLKLTLKDCEKIVPVSRSYISKVRNLLEKQ